jgi:hypothetical protein
MRLVDDFLEEMSERGIREIKKEVMEAKRKVKASKREDG